MNEKTQTITKNQKKTKGINRIQYLIRFLILFAVLVAPWLTLEYLITAGIVDSSIISENSVLANFIKICGPLSIGLIIGFKYWFDVLRLRDIMGHSNLWTNGLAVLGMCSPSYVSPVAPFFTIAMLVWPSRRICPPKNLSVSQKEVSENIMGSGNIKPQYDKLETDVSPLQGVIQSDVNNFVSNFLKVRSSIGELPSDFEYCRSNDPHSIKGTFDVNNYFSCFDKIKIQEGYLLDYVYLGDRHGGSPVLYSRKKEEEPIKSAEDFYNRFPATKKTYLGQELEKADYETYLPQLSFEPTPNGAFQFAIFAMLAHRFYLFWHACYNSRVFFFDKQSLLDSIEANADNLSPNNVTVLKSRQLVRVFQQEEDWMVCLLN
jgi:hypothetical protein